jgi:O-antigen ligase
VRLASAAAAALAAFSFLLWRAPLLVADEPSGALRLATALALLAGVAVTWMLAGSPRPQTSTKLAWWTAAFLTLVIVALVRGGMAGAMPWPRVILEAVQWTSLAGAAWLLASCPLPSAMKTGWVGVALGVYIALNVVLMLLGWENTRITGWHGEAQMLAAVGVYRDRVTFPTAEGLNNFGTMGGAALVMALVELHARRHRVLAAGAVAVALVALLVSDSRMALMAAVAVAAVAVTFRRRLAFPVAVAVLAFMTVAPLVLLGLSDRLDRLEVAQRVARNQSDLSTLNTRDEVWQGALTAHGAGSLGAQLFGHGAFGHVSSGATAHYEHLFSRSIESPTVHNSLLQYLLDTGYAGLLVIAGLVMTLLSRVYAGMRASVPSAGSLFAVLLYLGLTGVTEATATIYHPESLALLLFLSGAAAALPSGAAARAEGARYWRVRRMAADDSPQLEDAAPAFTSFPIQARGRS